MTLLGLLLVTTLGALFSQQVDDLAKLEAKYHADTQAVSTAHEKEVLSLREAWNIAMQRALDECLENKDLAGSNLINETLKSGPESAAGYSGTNGTAKAACRTLTLELQKAEVSAKDKTDALKRQYLMDLDVALAQAFEAKDLDRANKIDRIIQSVKESLDAPSRVPKDFDAQALKLAAIKDRDDARLAAITALRKAIGNRNEGPIEGRRLAIALDRAQDLGKMVMTVKDYEAKVPKVLRKAMDTAILELKQADESYRLELDRIEVLERALQIEKLIQAIRSWDTEVAFEMALRAEVIVDRSRLTQQHKSQYTMPAPPIPVEFQKAMEEFDQRRDALAESFDDEANSVADMFFRGLQPRNNAATPIARQIMDEAMTAVRSKGLDYAKLFPRFASDKDTLKFAEFQRSLSRIASRRNETWKSAVEELKAGLQPHVEELSSQERFDEALSVLWHVRERTGNFRPVAVLAAKKPWQAPVSPARVLDVAGNLCLLQFQDEDRPTWHPRQLIRLDGEKYRFGYEEAAFTDDWKLYDEFAPSAPVRSSSEVAVGQRVFFAQGKSWVLGEIRSITEKDAMVEWTDSRLRSESFAWKLLRAVD